MNVVPFRPRAQAEPLAFAIGARVDLRVGALTSGAVRTLGSSADAFGYTSLARLLRGARMAWLERGAHCGLSLIVPADVQATLDAELLSEAAIEAGCTRRSLTFQLNERELVTHGATLAEELRARGWGVALRGDPGCPLPFGAKARDLYCELVVHAPAMPDPFLAMDDGDRSPLGRRLIAAKAAGLVVTAESVLTTSHARTLAIAGFDRGGGPFAEAGLR